MTLSSKLFTQAGEDLQGALEAIDGLQSRVVIVDNEKLPYDQAIAKLDQDLIDQCDEVNEAFNNVETAYQDRIVGVCRTDMFWRIVGIDSTATPTEYDLVVTKISLNGYDDISSSGTGIGTMLAYVAVNGGITSLPLNSKIGITSDNLHGIKYYNEPYLLLCLN